MKAIKIKISDAETADAVELLENAILEREYHLSSAINSFLEVDQKLSIALEALKVVVTNIDYVRAENNDACNFIIDAHSAATEAIRKIKGES